MTHFMFKKKKSNNKKNLCRQQCKDGTAKEIVFTQQDEIFFKELDNVKSSQTDSLCTTNGFCPLAFGGNLALKFKILFTEDNQKNFCCIQSF